MFALKLNVEPGVDRLIDLSTCVDETITSNDLMECIGKPGIEKELRHKIDVFMSEHAYQTDFDADLTGPTDARIYVDDRLDIDSAVFIGFSDKDIAILTGKSIEDVRGTVYMAAKFFYETFTDGIDDGTITLCDIMDGILAALYYNINKVEYNFTKMTSKWMRLRGIRRNGVNVLNTEDPVDILTSLCS